MTNRKRLLAFALSGVIIAGGFVVVGKGASRQAQLDRQNDARKLTVSWNKKEEAVSENKTEFVVEEKKQETATKEKKQETTTTEKKQESKPAKSYDYSFKRIGNASRSVTKGKEIELSVKKGKNLKESKLSWSIKDTSILAFDDNDKSGDDVDIIGKKAGKTTVTCYNEKTKEKITFTVTVKNPASKTTTAKKETTSSSATKVSADNAISRKGSANRTVTVGKEIDLEVKAGKNVRDKDLTWSIKNKDLLKFEENDKTGDDVELIALKAGKTTVTCYNEKTKKSVSFTVTVQEKKAAGSSTIARKGSSTVYVELGDDEDVEVKATNVSSKNLKWTIKDTSIVRFEDGVSTGKEVELKGLKLGETTVTCTNQTTKKSVSYKVVVVRDDND